MSNVYSLTPNIIQNIGSYLDFHDKLSAYFASRCFDNIFESETSHVFTLSEVFEESTIVTIASLIRFLKVVAPHLQTVSFDFDTFVCTPHPQSILNMFQQIIQEIPCKVNLTLNCCCDCIVKMCTSAFTKINILTIYTVDRMNEEEINHLMSKSNEVTFEIIMKENRLFMLDLVKNINFGSNLKRFVATIDFTYDGNMLTLNLNHIPSTTEVVSVTTTMNIHIMDAYKITRLHMIPGLYNVRTNTLDSILSSQRDSRLQMIIMGNFDFPLLSMYLERLHNKFNQTTVLFSCRDPWILACLPRLQRRYGRRLNLAAFNINEYLLARVVATMMIFPLTIYNFVHEQTLLYRPQTFAECYDLMVADLSKDSWHFLKLIPYGSTRISQNSLIVKASL